MPTVIDVHASLGASFSASGGMAERTIATVLKMGPVVLACTTWYLRDQCFQGSWRFLLLSRTSELSPFSVRS